MSIQQTTPDLWQELKDALTVPQAADLKRLCELLDWAIAQLPEDQQLNTAGRAFEQMVDIYALRFNLLMAGWEGAEHLLEDALPVLDVDVLESWIRQSMSLNLDDLVEQPKLHRNRKKQTPDPNDSIVAIVEPEAVLQMVDQLEVEEHSHMIRRLAGEEDPTRWSVAIAQWMQEYSLSQPISISKLRLSLNMSWVEIWMGLLLGIGFSLEQTGDFYSNDIWIRYKSTEDVLC